jgi:GalNAc-alpha-(1->4)-GalNAc-alpha-(1->3)-diNAcBac-PP-undecaprenol alpha-1,4-N-acetyl-D-galactosaminyltransferase
VPEAMKIVFVLPTFGAGGAERVASLLCNAWSQAGHSVTAVTFEAPGEDQVHVLDEAVTLRQIDALNTNGNPVSRIATNVRRVTRLREALKSFAPDVIVAFTTEANVVTLWSARELGIPVVVSERNQPDRPGLGRLRKGLRRLTYPKASAIVVQTEAIANWARRRFDVPVHVLPNPVRLEAWEGLTSIRSPEKRLVAVGRLARQKGFDRLIANFARLAPKHPDWSLLIYGEGKERGPLEAEIERLGLNDRIFLPGVRKDMHGVFGSADLFVLSSRYEGYPNVLLEALAAGCPVIATDCPGAVADILDQGRYGMLVPSDDDDALALGLDRLMSDETLRASYAETAPGAVKDLEAGAVARRWLDLFAGFRAGSMR